MSLLCPAMMQWWLCWYGKKLTQACSLCRAMPGRLGLSYYGTRTTSQLRPADMTRNLHLFWPLQGESFLSIQLVFGPCMQQWVEQYDDDNFRLWILENLLWFTRIFLNIYPHPFYAEYPSISQLEHVWEHGVDMCPRPSHSSKLLNTV